MSKKFYTVKQVAEALGFSTNTVYKYLDEGRIQATRLGTEGRFRISEKEFLRLLDMKGSLQTGSSQIPETNSNIPETPLVKVQDNIEERAEAAEGESYEETAGFMSRISGPRLFDWFIATLSVFLGLSYFLFPGYVQKVNFEQYSSLHLTVKILLIIFGMFLMVTDIFIHRKKFLRGFVLITLAILFMLLSIPTMLTGNYLNAFGSFALGAFLILSLFIKANDFIKFFFLFLLMAGVSGGLFAYDFSYFPNLPVSSWILENRFIFILLWFLGFSLVFLGGIYGYFRNKTVLILSFGLGAVGAFVYASFAVFNAQWEQGIYAIIFGSFAFVFPFWKRFESLTKYSKKESLESFAWFFAVLVAGLFLVILVQNSLLGFSYRENEKGLQNATSIIQSFLKQSQEDVSRFGMDKELISLMQDSGKNFAAIDLKIREDYANSTTIRRILVLDKNGKGLTMYPYELNFRGTDFSDRNYFYLAKLQRKLIVSDAIKPRVGTAPVAVILGFPLYDENGEFLGVIAGSVDFGKLSQKISQIQFGTNGQFVIADSNKTIIIHPDPRFILTPIQPGGALDKAIKGESGNTQSYDEDGSLSIKSYAPLRPYGWGIKAQQPLEDLAKNNSRLSFVIFLVTIISGVGSILSTLFLKGK